MYHVRLPRRGLLAVIAMMIALITPGAPTGAGAPAAAQHGYKAREIIVKLYETVPTPGAVIDEIATAYNLTRIGQFGARPIYWLWCNTCDDTNPDKTPPGLANKIRSENPQRVEFAEPNYVGETPEERRHISWARGGSAGDYASQWALDKIRLPLAHALTRGKGSIVAVLDTGVDAGHPALQGRLLPGHDFVDNDDDPSEVGIHEQNVSYGHGTHVAGLVALAAPDAKIMPLRVLDASGSGNVWVLAEALQYAVDNGANVINMSLSTFDRTRLLEEIIGKLACGDAGACSATGQSNVVVVMAAGNSGDNQQEYPAAEAKHMGGALSVGATTQQDALADFSNYGPWVSLAAPGDQVLSSVPGGEYGSWSGTSMASPLVAGVAALVRTACPTMNPLEVTNQITTTAATIGGKVPLRVDAVGALQFPASTGCQGIKLVYLPLVVR